MTSLPLDVQGRHALAVPAGADLLTLARAWFPQAEWVRQPVSVTEAHSRAPRMSGARFRGMVAQPVAEAGELRVTDEVSARGPFTLDADACHAVGLPARRHELWTVERVDPAAASPVPDEPRVLGWMAAAARRCAGGILPADHPRAVVPDPASVVDLTLWSPTALTADVALPLVRPTLSGSRVTVAAGGPVPHPEPGAPAAWAPYELVAQYEYDGAVRVAFARSREVPVVLASLDWREYGPFAYRVTWSPPDDGEYRSDSPSHLHLIARGRIAPFVARAAAALVGSAGGAVVDSDGYLVSADEIATRAAATRR